MLIRKWQWLTYNLTTHKQKHSGIITFGFLLCFKFLPVSKTMLPLQKLESQFFAHQICYKSVGVLQNRIFMFSAVAFAILRS